VRVGEARPPPFTLFTITYQVECMLQLRGQIHSSYFISITQPSHYIYHNVQSCDVRSRWEGRFTHPFSILSLYM